MVTDVEGDVVGEDVRVDVGDVLAVVVGEVVGVLRWHPSKVPSIKDPSARLSTPAVSAQLCWTFTAPPTVHASVAALVPREYSSTAFTRASLVAAQSFSLTHVTAPATTGPHDTAPDALWHLVSMALSVVTCALQTCTEDVRARPN